MTKARGFTLIELMVAMAIMLVATLAASSLMIAGASLNKNAERTADAQDAARMGGMTLAKAIQSAGLFTPHGIYMNVPGNTNTLVSPVWTSPHSTSAPDDLWVISPTSNVLLDPCQGSTPGAVVQLAASSPSLPITVQCVPGAYSAAPAALCTDPSCSVAGAAQAWLVVANITVGTGALLTPGLTFGTASVNGVSYATITAAAESANSAFSDNPAGAGGTAGFNKSDPVFQVTATHYFVCSAGTGAGSCNSFNSVFGTRPALVKETAVLGTLASAPLVWPSTRVVSMVQSNIENLQLVFETDPSNSGNAATYVPSFGFAPGYTATTNLRSIRVDLVAVGANPESNTGSGVDEGATGPAALAPMPVDNYTPSPATPDGYRRFLNSQRIELVNLTPGNL